ncbi:MAG: glycosyltransferase family 4 protein [Chitinophagales bacterium]
MRILYLNYEFPPIGGGASPASYEIAKEYVALGHQVTVVTMYYHGLPTYEEVDGIQIYRVKCLRKKVNVSHPYEQFTYLLSAMSFLREHLKNVNYDMCHCHFLIPTGFLAYWVKKHFKIPYIVTIHGSDVPGYNPDRFQFLHRFTPPILRRIVEESYRVTSGSVYLIDLLLKNVGNFEEKMIHIPNGIDANIYVPFSKKPIIFSSGRLLERKGFQYLIEAVKMEDIGFEVHIAGDGPMRRRLEDLAEGAKTNVVFHGWLDNTSEKYKRLLGEASIFSLISAKENASVSLLEAMSAACVVVTSNVSGCPETIGDAGLKIAPENSLLLKQAFEELIRNPIKIKELSSLARDKVMNDYNWKILTKRYEALLFN